MLVLCRKSGEKVVLGNGITLTVVEVSGKRVRLAFETPHAGNGRPTENDAEPVQLARAMRRALKRAANYAMRQDNAAEAANEALALLRAELVWRFDLLRSRQRQPVLIDPEPLPPIPTNTCQLNACSTTTEQKAVEARERAKGLPGFRDKQEEFHIDCYAVDRNR